MLTQASAGDPMVAVAIRGTSGRGKCAKDPGRTCTVWRPARDPSPDGLIGHSRVAAGQGVAVGSPASCPVLFSLCCPCARADRGACCSLAGQRPRFVKGNPSRRAGTWGRGRGCLPAGTRGRGGQKPEAAVTVMERRGGGMINESETAGKRSGARRCRLRTVAASRGWLRAPPAMRGLLPVDRSQVPADVLAGMTLAALGIPEVLGYAKIAGMPVVTGLYTMLLPMAVFAVLGSSRHLVVGRGLRYRRHPRRRADRARGRRVGAIRPAGRARGPARRRDAAAGPAGPARVPGEFPFPHRPGRIPHRRRHPGGGRPAPRRCWG